MIVFTDLQSLKVLCHDEGTQPHEWLRFPSEFGSQAYNNDIITIYKR